MKCQQDVLHILVNTDVLCDVCRMKMQSVYQRFWLGDLACEGFDVIGKIVIHHINPLTLEDVVNRAASIFDPENVISTSFQTHNAIHYGSENVLGADPIERKPNDTCPWKR